MIAEAVAVNSALLGLLIVIVVLLLSQELSVVGTAAVRAD